MLFVRRFIFDSHAAFQLQKDLEPPLGVRRSSNSGFRKTKCQGSDFAFSGPYATAYAI